jgi:hypothetical protein
MFAVSVLSGGNFRLAVRGLNYGRLRAPSWTRPGADHEYSAFSVHLQLQGFLQIR